MSQENVEIVRRMLKAYAQGGFPASARFTHSAFEMRFQASHPLAGVFRGLDAAEAMTEFTASFDDFRGEAERVVDAGNDQVVVAFRERGRPRGSGVELNDLFGIVCTLSDGKITRMEWFSTPDEALKAVGLEE